MLNRKLEGGISALVHANKNAVDPDLRKIVHCAESQQHTMLLELLRHTERALVDGGSGTISQVGSLTFPGPGHLDRVRGLVTELECPETIEGDRPAKLVPVALDAGKRRRGMDGDKGVIGIVWNGHSY